MKANIEQFLKHCDGFVILFVVFVLLYILGKFGGQQLAANLTQPALSLEQRGEEEYPTGARNRTSGRVRAKCCPFLKVECPVDHV